MPDRPLGERVTDLEVKMQDLMGNHQPGLIAQHDARLKEVETTHIEIKTFLKFAKWWGPILGAALAFATGGGRVSLEKLLQHFGM